MHRSRSPEAARLAEVGYLMRTTAVYGGLAAGDRLALEHRALTLESVDIPLLCAGILIPRLPDGSWLMRFGGNILSAHEGVMIAHGRCETRHPATLTISPGAAWPAYHDGADGQRLDGLKRLYQQGIALEETTWHLLQQYFRRTLVPSDSASRTHGAGAGTTDND